MKPLGSSDLWIYCMNSEATHNDVIQVDPVFVTSALTVNTSFCILKQNGNTKLITILWQIISQLIFKKTTSEHAAHDSLTLKLLKQIKNFTIWLTKVESIELTIRDNLRKRNRFIWMGVTVHSLIAICNQIRTQRSACINWTL